MSRLNFNIIDHLLQNNDAPSCAASPSSDSCGYGRARNRVHEWSTMRCVSQNTDPLFKVNGLRWGNCNMALLLFVLLFMTGCGTTKSFTATEQLLMSDAVDSTISKIDFRPLSGHKVYLDTTYVMGAGKVIPGVAMPINLVNSDYVISALRQQLTAAGCMIVDTRDLADIICEARCGALGTDGHSVTYGLPANNFLNSASAVIPGTPSLPSIPEISVARREMKSAAVKVAVFAYDRETREPLWQSGVSQAGSNARDTWVLGVGPLQYGTIYNGTRFAGKRLKKNAKTSLDESSWASQSNGIDHRSKHLFANRIFSPKSEATEIAKKEEAPDASIKR